MGFIPKMQGEFNRIKNVKTTLIEWRGKITHYHLNEEKGFNRVEYPFMIKTFIKLRMEGNFLKLVKSIPEKPTDNILLNDERLQTFLRWRIRYGCPFSPLLFYIVLKVLAKKVDKIKKRHPNWKRKSKPITINKWHDLTYKKKTHKATRPNEFIKISGYKINTQKSVVFLWQQWNFWKIIF